MKWSCCWLLSTTLAGFSGSACTAYDAELIEPLSQATLPSAVQESPLPVLTRCGDGVISGPEKCDLGIDLGEPGACPFVCPALAPCAQRVLNGSACQAECVLLAPSCMDGDGCCSGNCTAGNDRDCSSSCGNGTIEAERGETCERGSTIPCVLDAAQCDDADPCTLDLLIGSARNCNSECLAIPVTKPIDGDGCCVPGADANRDDDCMAVCGNGVREPGEECDSSAGCSSECTLAPTPAQVACMRDFAADACQRCSCMQCTERYLDCRNGRDAAQNALCSAVIDCTQAAGCFGVPCYCGAPPICGVPPGPCQTEIEAAAGTTDPWAIGARRNDLSNPLGRANAADACRLVNCAEECRPTTP